jgi:hypothetical protein
LYLAAEHLAGREVVASIDRSPDRLLNGLTREPSPTLRTHLLLRAAADADPCRRTAHRRRTPRPDERS